MFSDTADRPIRDKTWSTQILITLIELVLLKQIHFHSCRLYHRQLQEFHWNSAGCRSLSRRRRSSANVGNVNENSGAVCNEILLCFQNRNITFSAPIRWRLWEFWSWFQSDYFVYVLILLMTESDVKVFGQAEWPLQLFVNFPVWSLSQRILNEHHVAIHSVTYSRRLLTSMCIGQHHNFNVKGLIQHLGTVLLVGANKVSPTDAVFIHHGVCFLHYFQRRVPTSGQNPRITCNKTMGIHTWFAAVSSAVYMRCDGSYEF